MKLRRSGHDMGRVVRDLAVMLADGGDCLSDLGALGDQAALFGPVFSDATAFRVIDRIASDPGGLERLRSAHASARARVWEIIGAPELVEIDLDATLIGAHSEKEGAAGNFKGGYGFHPMLAYADETGEALAGELRPGNAGANTAADQIKVAEHAIAQIPEEHIESIRILLRADSAGQSHELLDWCREARIRYSVGYELNDSVRTQILKLADGGLGLRRSIRTATPRTNGQVAEITSHLDLAGWPEGSQGDRAPRARAPRRAAHLHRPRRAPLPGDPDRPARRDPRRARAPSPRPARTSRITSETTKTPARATCPSNSSSTTAHLAPGRPDRPRPHHLDERLLLTGKLARCEPKRLRYRILHVAGRFAFDAAHRDTPTAGRLALGDRAHRRVPAPGRPPRATRLTLLTATPDRGRRRALGEACPPTQPPHGPHAANATRNQRRVPDHDTPEPLKPERAAKRSHQTPCCKIRASCKLADSKAGSTLGLWTGRRPTLRPTPRRRER